VRRAKGGRRRVVPIHPALVALFDDYLATRLPLTHERALLTGVQGRRLTETIMAVTFRRYAHAAGVTERKRVTPHTLRHVFATSCSAPVPTCARSRSCSATSTWTPPSATRASPPISCAARSSGCRGPGGRRALRR
jgi:Phage integrase family